MSSWENNIYSNPEKHGLELVGEVSWMEASYEFDFTAIWYDRQTRTFYWGNTAGCSCNGPFDYTENKSELDSGTFHEAAAALQGTFAEEKASSGSYFPSEAEADVTDLIARMREL